MRKFGLDYRPEDIDKGLGEKFIKFIGIGYSIFLMFYSLIFLEFWKRKQAFLSVQWGMDGEIEEHQIRPQFQGRPIYDKITE